VARTRELKVKITGDERDLARALGRTDNTASKWGSRLASFGKVAAFGLAGAGVAAVKFGLDFVKAAEESVKIGKQTEAVIKSTGGAAHVTAAAVGELAEKLSLKSGIDDEVIQSGQNVLLTFTQIRNEVGKGNDIFDQATSVALDMSVALGTDLQGSVIQIGKALNDPIKGITALTRVGVTFTQQQKDQIATLVESGDTLGAQKVILAELTKEFGGSAEAQATATDKLRVAFDNMGEEIGMVLLPYVNQFSDWLVKKGVPLIRDEFVPWLRDEAVPAIQDFAHWVGVELVPKLKDFGAVMQRDVLPALQSFTEALVGLPGAVQVALASLGVLVKFGGFGILSSAVVGFGKLIATVFGVIGVFVTGIWRLITVTVPFAHIATLAFIFRGQLAGVFAAISGFAVRTFNNVQNWGATAVRAVGGFFVRLGGQVANVFAGIGRSAASAARTVISWFAQLPGRIGGFVSGVAGAFSRLPGRLASAARSAVNAFMAPFRDIPGMVSSILSRVPGAGIVKRGLGLLNPFGAVGGIVTPKGIQYLQIGGFAKRGTDIVPAMLTPGEMILTEQDQRNLLGMIRSGAGANTAAVVNIYMAGAIVSSEAQFERMVRRAIGRMGTKGTQITLRGRPL